MDPGNVYVQFSSVREALFTVEHGLRPKFEFERIDQLSQFTSYGLVTIRFVLEALQMLPLVTLRDNVFDCDGWLSCGFQYVALPFNSSSTVSQTFHVAVQSVLTFFCVLWGIFIILSSTIMRKRDINLSGYRVIVSGICSFATVYYQDIVLLATRSLFCHFHSYHHNSGSSSCTSGGAAVNIGTGALLLLTFIPASFISTSLSLDFDFRRFTGRITSVRMDLWTQLMKCIFVLPALIIHSEEHIHTSTTTSTEDPTPTYQEFDHLWAVRIGAYAVFGCMLAFLLTFQLLQAPHTRGFDNRVRAGSIGALLGVVVVAFVNAIVNVVNDNPASTDSLLADPDSSIVSGISNVDLVQGIAGTFLGCMVFGGALGRKRALGRLLQIDINNLTGEFDHAYASALVDIIRTSTEEELNEICGGSSGPVQTNSKTGVTSNLNHVFTQGADFFPARAARKTSFQQLQPTKLRPLPRQNSVASPPSSPIGRPSQADFDDLVGCNEEELMTIASSPANSPSTAIAVHNASTQLAPVTTSKRPRQNVSPTLTPPAVSPLMQVRNAAARDRLKTYMSSQNFSLLHKRLNFDSDLEMTLRTLCEEWAELAEPQKDVAKAALLQLFAALYLKTSRGQDGSVPPSYFLWFAAACLTLWSDLDLCAQGIRIAAEAPSMAFDTAFLCYLLQKASEDIRNNTATTRRTTGVSDMAAFRRWTASAKASHEKALVALRRFFKTATQSSALSRVSAMESDRNLPSSELKNISDATKQLKEALTCVKEAEGAYESLLQRYPAVPSVQTMVTSFHRQFFREMESARHDSRPAPGSNPDAASGGVLNPGKDDSDNGVGENGSTITGSQATSMGSGLADTPKQVKLAFVRDAVGRTFSRIRWWSFTSLAVVIVISAVLLVVAIMELWSVEDWLGVFESIGEVFGVMPTSCAAAMRGTMGAAMIAGSFGAPVRDKLLSEEIVKKIQLRGGSTTGRDLDQDYADCVHILTVTPMIHTCVVAYNDGSSMMAKFNYATGTFEQKQSYPDQYNKDPEEMDEELYASTYWYHSTKSFDAAGIQTWNNGYYKSGFIPTAGFKDISLIMTCTNLYFAPHDAVGQTQTAHPHQGVFMVAADNLPHFHYVWHYAIEIPSTIEKTISATNELERVALDMGITPLSELTSQPGFFKTLSHNVNGTYEQEMSFTEGVAYFAANLDYVYQRLMHNWRYSELMLTNEYKNLFEFCASDNVPHSEVLLDTFREFLSSTVKDSEFVITICACGAMLIGLLGAILSSRLIRKFLAEFDRSDGVTPALAVVATFPKSELRRIAKSIHSLRVDRGIFDPDDERAAFMDLTVSRKTQKYQDALLKAHQAARERDRELGNEFGLPDGTMLHFRLGDKQESHKDLTQHGYKTEFDSAKEHGHDNQQFTPPTAFSNILSSPQDYQQEQQNNVLLSNPPSKHRSEFSAAAASSVGASADPAGFPSTAPLEIMALPAMSPISDAPGNVEEVQTEHGVVIPVAPFPMRHGSAPLASPTPDKPNANVLLSNHFGAHKKNLAFKNTTTHGHDLTSTSKGGFGVDHGHFGDDSTVASTRKTGGSSVGSLGFTRRVTNAVCRRPLTRGYTLIWLFMMLYVGVSLIICILSVGSFQYVYDVNSELMEVTFSWSIAALYSVYVQRGTSIQILSNFDDYLAWAKKYHSDGRTKFFDLIDGPPQSGEGTFGRSYQDGAALLYDPTCLSTSSGWGCGTDRSQWHKYTNEQYASQGLVRAMIYWSSRFEDHVMQFGLESVDAEGKPVGRSFDAKDGEAWFFMDSFQNDIAPGLASLRKVTREDAASQVEADSTSQVLLLCGGVVAGILAAVTMENLIRARLRDFQDTLLLFRMLPTRLTDDYRVIEKVLNVSDEDDGIEAEEDPRKKPAARSSSGGDSGSFSGGKKKLPTHKIIKF